MEQVRLLWQQIEEINQALALAMKDHVAVLCRLSKIPGVDLYAAQDLLAEIGPRAAAFPSAEQFASWVGVCPGSKESAGVNYSSRSPKGNRYLRRVLMQVAWGAIHTKKTFYAGLFQRLKSKLKAKGAAWAVAHRMAKVIWLIMHEEVEYQERGPALPNPRTLKRRLRKLLQEFEGQGMNVKQQIEEALAARA
jgi:transposase